MNFSNMQASSIVFLFCCWLGVVECLSNILNCLVAPTSAMQADWCTICHAEPKTNLSCSVCDPSGMSFVTVNKNSCSAQECAVKPSTGYYTTEWCTACELTKTEANEDKTGCLMVNCSAKPQQGQFYKEWCSRCFSPARVVNAKKTVCISTDTTIETTHSYHRWFSVICFLTIFLFYS